VDIGGDRSKANPLVLPYRRENDRSIENALKKIGLNCDDTNIIIISHLDWDFPGHDFRVFERKVYD
jgi:hypothetical protein